MYHWGYVKKYALHEHKSNNMPRKPETSEKNLYLICHYKFNMNTSGDADLKQLLIIEMYTLGLDSNVLQQPE